LPFSIIQGSDRPWKTWKTWKYDKFSEKSGKHRETQGNFFFFPVCSGKLREFYFLKNEWKKQI